MEFENNTNIPTEGQVEVQDFVSIITQISCILSMIGSVLIILTYMLWKDIRTSSRLLLVYLSIADFVTAAGYGFGSIYDTVQRQRNITIAYNDSVCIAESLIANNAQMMSFFWTICIAVFLYVTIVLGKLQTAERMIKYFHVISWGLPTIIIFVAFLNKALGSDGSDSSVGWCWINTDPNGKGYRYHIMWMMLVGKGWELCSYIIIPLLYIRIKCHIRQQSKTPGMVLNVQKETIEAMLKVNHKLTFIPVVFLLLRIWGTVRFFIYLLKPGTMHQANLSGLNAFLLTMHGVGDTFQGGANCILFCFFTDSVRVRIFAGLYRYCPCFRLIFKFCMRPRRKRSSARCLSEKSPLISSGKK